MRDFRKLEIWHLGMKIVQEIYALTAKLPPSERFGLQLQMRKAVVSMPSNIAEGCSRSSNKDTRRFLEISLGSAFELETQLLAAQMIGFFTEEDVTLHLPVIQEFQRKTNAYKGKIND